MVISPVLQIKIDAQRGDVTSQDQVPPLQVQATGAAHPNGPSTPCCPQVGDITILVNNAAVVHGKSLMDSDDDALLKSQHVNTLGQFWVSLS